MKNSCTPIEKDYTVHSLQIMLQTHRDSIQWGPFLVPYPDPGGQKLPTNIEKVNKISFLKCWMFSLFGGLKASPVAWTS